MGRWLSLTCIGVLCKAKPLWPACISVIDKAKVKNLACAAEQLADLLFGQPWGKMWSVVRRRAVDEVIPGLTIGNVAHKDNPRWGLGRHCEQEFRVTSSSVLREQQAH